MKGRKFYKNPWIIALFTIFLLFQSCSYALKNSWKSSVPDRVKMGKVLTSTSDWIVPPGGSCGGAIIQLKNKSAIEIQREGLGFFEDQNQSQKSKGRTISWSQGASDNRGWISYQCAVKSSSKEKYYQQELRSALKSKNAYYGVPSGKSKTRILIATEQRLVFVGYWD